MIYDVNRQDPPSEKGTGSILISQTWRSAHPACSADLAVDSRRVTRESRIEPVVGLKILGEVQVNCVVGFGFVLCEHHGLHQFHLLQHHELPGANRGQHFLR
jgi:hypothetical protein